jgi:hypothetical protein
VAAKLDAKPIPDELGNRYALNAPPDHDTRTTAAATATSDA